MSRVSPEVLAPRARNPRTTYLETGLELANPMEPWFRFGPLTTDTMLIAGRPTLNGDAPILVPFRFANADYTKRFAHVMSIPNNWTIDMDATTIDLDTFIGGIIDGLSLTADIDYLIWAFSDEYGNFKGFGLTTLPRVTGASTADGGGLGASGTFTVTSGHGWRFCIGARVIIRDGYDRGDNYNQGTITAIASNSITVDLDGDYSTDGEIDVEGNTTLASLTRLEIFQTDRFAPRMYNEDSLYPGSGVEHQYAYVGSLQTNDSSNIRHPRKRGKWYAFPLDKYHVYSQTSSTTVMQNVCLARWLPIGTGHVRGSLAVSGASITSYLEIATDMMNGTWSLTSSRPSGSGIARVSFESLLRLHNAAMHFHFNVSGGSSTGDGYVSGYIAETF